MFVTLSVSTLPLLSLVYAVVTPSLVDEIFAIASCQREQAQDIYERWIAKTRTDGELTIGGVGVLRGKSFVADKVFASTINPKGVKTLVIKKKSSHAWIYAVCAVAVVVALALFAYLQWGDNWDFIGCFTIGFPLQRSRNHAGNFNQVRQVLHHLLMMPFTKCTDTFLQFQVTHGTPHLSYCASIFSFSSLR